MAYRITLSNAGGELDCRIVARQEDARAAALDLISGAAELLDGDSITVTEYRSLKSDDLTYRD